MKYIKGGLLVAILIGLVMAFGSIYRQRQEIEQAGLNAEQNLEQFAQTNIDDFDHMQNNLEHTVQDAEKTYSAEFGL